MVNLLFVVTGAAALFVLGDVFGVDAVVSGVKEIINHF